MPEIGDDVVLYLPTENENDAYVQSSTHFEYRDDSNQKSIRTKQGKQIVFTPEGIYIDNGKGSSIILDDENGISISTNGNIDFIAKEGITIDARDELTIESSKEVAIRQTDNQIRVNDTIDISGSHVRIQ